MKNYYHFTSDKLRVGALARTQLGCDGGIMFEDYEIFGTKDQADAFVEGFRFAVALIDDDHAHVSDPESTGENEWRVNYSHSC